MGHVADVIASSWARVDHALRDELTDPRVAAFLVSPLSRTFYWEVHFQEARLTGVDFLHRLPLGPAGEAATPAPDSIAAALSGWFSDPEVARYCHESAWLEADGPLARAEALRPQGVSICLDRHIGSTAPRDRERLACSTSAVLGIFSRLRAACGCARVESDVDILVAVHDAVLEAGGILRHLSVMRGREGEPSKMYVALPKPRLASFLERIGWPGDVRAACQLAELVHGDSQRIHLDLQLRDGLTPRIGFELFFDPSPAIDLRRRAPLTLARTLQVLTPAQARALATWPGSFQVARTGHAPDIQQWLDLKFVLQGDRIELKSYLGFRIREGML